MKVLYSPCSGFKYKDGFFGAGLVKNSEHKVNKVYLQVNNSIFHLRHDEAYALISSLGAALWTDYQLPKQDKIKLKWKTEKQIEIKRSLKHE